MHELALSDRIVRIVLDASGVPRSRITAVAVRVGALSAVSLSALEFCLRTMLDESGMAHTEARVTWVPARVRCACGRIYETEDVFSPCPDCGGFTQEVVAGGDVVVQHVEVEDDEKG